MNISDYIVYLWVVPVILQILLPLVILCGWFVLKFFSILRAGIRAEFEPTPVAAG